MKLRVGETLQSAIDTTAVIVMKAPAGEVGLTCGGVGMFAKGAAAPTGEVVPAHFAGSLLGKRYVNASGTLELLCTRAGEGSLALDGKLLATAEAKSLPSSD